MKKILLLIAFVSVLFACSDSGKSNKNPYIPNYSINLSINRSLPAYSVLTYPGNGVLVPGYGAKGIIIFSNGIDTYNAFDAACPNQALSSCSTLTIKDMNAICPCDNAAYNLYTGLGGKEYPLKQYRVELIGNVIHVYN